jgi:hypothetical protein
MKNKQKKRKKITATFILSSKPINKRFDRSDATAELDSWATYTTRTAAAAATASGGLPRPMVNPRVPSGILGPCAACLGVAARDSRCAAAPAACAEECCAAAAAACGRPRPLPHGFLAPACWSSCCRRDAKEIVS